MVPAFFCVRTLPTCRCGDGCGVGEHSHLHVGVGMTASPFNFLETTSHVGCEIVSKKLK